MGILRLKQLVATRTTLGAYIPANRHFITVCGFRLPAGRSGGRNISKVAATAVILIGGGPPWRSFQRISGRHGGHEEAKPKKCEAKR
jgi:hypothetical protein